MTAPTRGDRPLSPHLQIYKPQITSVLSIVHRVTGVAMLAGAALLVWWFFAAASGPEAFALADSALSSPIGDLIMLGSTFALSYHLLNGIRHLIWDAGYGFELGNVTKSGWAVVIGAVALTVLVWWIAQ